MLGNLIRQRGFDQKLKFLLEARRLGLVALSSTKVFGKIWLRSGQCCVEFNAVDYKGLSHWVVDKHSDLLAWQETSSPVRTFTDSKN
jgi:hypothetical protein